MNDKIKITFKNDFISIGSKDDALTALIHLGYLGYDADIKKAFVPNYEVATAFESALQTGEWKEIAKAISIQQKKKPIRTTTDLREVIEKALSFLPKAEQKEAVKKSSQRSFQALRIDVNSEYEVLESFLESLPDILAPGGRVAILKYHSREDRLVKKSFQRFYKEGIYEDIAKNVIRPSAEECNRNSRAHSTKMRWAIRK